MTDPDTDIRYEKRSMASEDKVLLWILSFAAASLFIGALICMRFIFVSFGILNHFMEDGISLKSAFILGLGLSFFFMIFFALVAGDGLVGELGVMLVGFFLMLTFFTVTIALIF